MLYIYYMYVYIHISYFWLSHACIEWIFCIVFFTKRNECHFDKNARQVEHGWRCYNSPIFWIIGWITRYAQLLKPPFAEHILPVPFVEHILPCKLLNLNFMSVCFWSFVTLLGITLQEINISHLGKRKIIFKMDFSGDMLVPRRVNPEVTSFPRSSAQVQSLASLLAFPHLTPSLDVACQICQIERAEDHPWNMEEQQKTWMVTV